MQHALGTASLLSTLNLDVEALAAAVLCNIPQCLQHWKEPLQAAVGENICNLVSGIAEMERINLASQTLEQQHAQDIARQVEGLRKMLLAMVQDIRVVLIKLAERTHTLRYLSGATLAQQKQIAQETRDIYAPLANRLGVWQLKWELEDFSVRYLEPDLYKRVAKLLDERRVDREQYILDVVNQLQQALQQAGIPAAVSGRPKHICSIINKMKRKQMDFHDLYDVRAVRILTDSITQCYEALGLVHQLWTPITNEFDDYIAHPKSNRYRSLHTAVVGPRGLTLEVQIRTHEMHRHSELGVAAHWRYKEGSKSDAQLDEKISWLRQIMAWQADVTQQQSLQPMPQGLLNNEVYVFTPQGKVIALPHEATPVDFAYALHTELGHRTRGAKVDGNIVPLSYSLQNGQCVEILTVKQGAPSRDWLNPALGFLHSAGGRAKVRAWFRHQHHDESVAQGRIQLDRELHRLGIASINQEKVAQQLHYNKLEDLLAALGRDEVSQRRLAVVIQELLPTKAATIPKLPALEPNAKRTTHTGITVGGISNLMTRVAKCCNASTSDTIVGYITRDRGITIHRTNCAFILHLPQDMQYRMIPANWETRKNPEP